MKKKIFLIRHGESADKQQGQSDFDRVLTPQGRISIELLGKFFKREKFTVELVISSPSIRTRETSAIISNVIDYSVDEIEFQASLYNGSDQDYLSVVSYSSPSLMIIGHNPAVSFVIGKLTGDYSISLAPGQCALLESDLDENSKSTFQLVKLIGPFH